MKLFSTIAAAILIAGGSVLGMNAEAATIIDQSPAVIGSTDWGAATDSSSGQNIMVQMVLSQTTTISGMTIYLEPGYYGSVETAEIKIRGSDNTGQPTSTNEYDYQPAVVAINTNESTNESGSSGLIAAHTTFKPTTLAAGTWWIGFSWISGGGSWDSIETGPVQPTTQVLLQGNNLDTTCCFSTDHPTSYEFPYIIDNNSVSQTPLPAALPLFAGGLGALGLLGWRRKRKARAA
jgi:hypothetical protein